MVVRRERKSASTDLLKKLGTYAVAGAAATTGLDAANGALMASSATVTVGTLGDSVGVDIDGDTVTDFTFSVDASFNGAGFPTSTFFNIAGAGTNAIGLANLAGATTYNGVNQYLVPFTSVASTFGPLVPGTFLANAGVAAIRYPGAGGTVYGFAPNGPLGLVFDIGGNTHYGEARVTDTGPFGNGPITWSFNWETTPDTAIPEPASLMLLAMGAAGLVRRRRA